MEPQEWLCFAGNISKRLRKIKVQWKRGRLALKKNKFENHCSKKNNFVVHLSFFPFVELLSTTVTWNFIPYLYIDPTHEAVYSFKMLKHLISFHLLVIKKEKNCYVNTWCFFMFVGISWESSQSIAKKTLYWNKCSEISLLLFCEAGKVKDQILSSEFDTFTLLM